MCIKKIDLSDFECKNTADEERENITALINKRLCELENEINKYGATINAVMIECCNLHSNKTCCIFSGSK